MLHRRNRSKKNRRTRKDPEKYRLKIKTTPKLFRFIKDAEHPNFINNGLKKRKVLLMILLLMGSGIMSIIEHGMIMKVIYIIISIIVTVLIIGSLNEIRQDKMKRRKRIEHLQRIEDRRTIL